MGWVPLMNISLTLDTVPGPGSIPLKASTVTSTSPSGRSNFAIGSFWLTSVRIRDQTGAEDASDSASLFGDESELPIHTPTARAGAFGSPGGARYPKARVSLLSFVVPVLYAAGRRVVPLLVFSRMCHLPQYGLMLGFGVAAQDVRDDVRRLWC